MKLNVSTIRRWRAMTAVAAGSLILIALAGAANPATAGAASTVSATYSTTGETPFIVPAGVHGITVALSGASGGAGLNEFSFDDAPGGPGGVVHGVISVYPGEVLFAEIGGRGAPGTGLGAGAGGVNGGGSGGLQAPAGGGGGATDVRRCSLHAPPLNPPICSSLPTAASRLLVAGGGGGGGGSASAASFYFGGAGGGVGSGGGAGGQGSAPAGGGGGGPGTATAGGLAGINSDSTPPQAGSLARGGAGGYESGTNWGGGGGGGAGIYGGGGGGGGECVPHSTSVCGGGGGGGGGLSGRPTGVTGVTAVSMSVSTLNAAPHAKFSWVLPPPTAITGNAASVNATSASLSGVVDPNGFPVTGCHFNVAPASPAGSSMPCSPKPATGTTPVLVSARLNGLTPSTIYTVRLVATSANGTRSGAARKFKTKP